MKTKAFGWTDERVPLIGQGTWHMGESARQRQREVAALQLGLEHGMTHIDTAEMYGRGGAEKVIAEAIRDRRRGELFLVSKVLPENASQRGTTAAAEASLRRLGTDYLDLYLLHWRGRHALADTMGAMEDLVSAGKVRFVGVSNFEVDDLREAMAALSRQRLACNQVLYNLRQREIEAEVLPFCADQGIAVVAYTPFDGVPGQGTRAWRALQEIGRRHGKTPRQVVLRFLTRTPALFAIPKATDPDHVRENSGAGDFDLDAADVETIERLFPKPSSP